MSNRDLTKEMLYEGVKLLLGCESHHIHLPQQKLYTQFSIGFQYLLFLSTKKPGHYIVRIEDSALLEKLQRKAKDDSSRKFMQKLALPRKFKYGNSLFHLDFFNFTTWNNTNELAKDKVHAALIVKNTSKKPMDIDLIAQEDEQVAAVVKSLPANYYIESLREYVPKTVTIAFDETYEGYHKIYFPFIKEAPKERLLKGVNISSEINLKDLEDLEDN